MKASDKLRDYYKREMPVEDIFEWLKLVNTTFNGLESKEDLVDRRSAHPGTDEPCADLPRELPLIYGKRDPSTFGYHKSAMLPDCKWPMYPLANREFVFWFENGNDDSMAINRRLSFTSAEQFRKALVDNVPTRIELGAVYRYAAGDKSSMIANVPVMRELVFDYDISDKREYLLCCDGASVCSKCWIFIRCAIRCTIAVLSEFYGINQPLIVFSGKKGVHIYATGYEPSTYSESARSLIIDQLRSLSKLAVDVYITKSKVAELCLPIMSSECDEYFRQFSSDLLASKFPGRALLHSESYEDAFQFVKGAAYNNLKIPSKLRTSIAFMVESMCPKPDAAITTQMAHLVKMMWCIHPSTGKVCVPISVDQLKYFDPSDVPCIGSSNK